MFKKILPLLILSVLFIKPSHSYAWGKDGHQIVAQIAAHYLSDTVKQRVQKYLGNMSFEEAATWMDEAKSNDFFRFMSSWHYINIDKGDTYKPVVERNILTVLHAAITDLKKKNEMKKSDVKRDLQYIFHLVGDLHQPLHVGYGSDRGGNDVQVSYLFKSYSSNLHSVWDTEIIQSEKITADSCYALYNTLSPTDVNRIKQINELQWMKESRSLLDTVYNFNDGFLTKNYVMDRKSIVKRQLLLGGLRLAAVLQELFKD